MQEEKPSQETKNQWHNDPDNWVLGIFYFNRKDKRIFPPKRLAFLGWTVNFANPLSVLIFALMIIGIILLVKFANG